MTVSLLTALVSLLMAVNQPGVPVEIRLQAYQLAQQAIELPKEEISTTSKVNVKATGEILATSTEATSTLPAKPDCASEVHNGLVYKDCVF